MKKKIYLSLNEKGELEYLTREEFKRLHLGYSYVRLVYGNFEQLFFVPYQKFLNAFDGFIACDGRFLILEDFAGNYKILYDDFKFAKIYNRVKMFFAELSFAHKRLKFVECSRYLKSYLEKVFEKGEENETGVFKR